MSQFAPPVRGVLHLDSTATQRTFAGALLWLRCPMHQGTPTGYPSSSSLAEARERSHGNIPRANQISVQRIPPVWVFGRFSSACFLSFIHSPLDGDAPGQLEGKMAVCTPLDIHPCVQGESATGFARFKSVVTHCVERITRGQVRRTSYLKPVSNGEKLPLCGDDLLHAVR